MFAKAGEDTWSLCRRFGNGNLNGTTCKPVVSPSQNCFPRTECLIFRNFLVPAIRDHSGQTGNGSEGVGAGVSTQGFGQGLSECGQDLFQQDVVMDHGWQTQGHFT